MARALPALTVPRRRRPLRPLAAAALALLLLFAALETALWLFGRRLYPYPDARLSAETVGGRDVWCLGDSHTQGAGAPPGQSYPDELGRLLAPAGRRVLNLGYGATNSSQQFRRLEAAFAFGTPRVVVYMGGINNGWNLVQADRRTLREVYGPGGVLLSELQRLRSFKLLVNHVLAPALGRGRAAGLDAVEEALLVHQDADFVLRRLGRKPFLTAQERFLLAAARLKRGRYAEALDDLERVAPVFRGAPLTYPVDLIAAEARRLAEGRAPSEATRRFYAQEEGRFRGRARYAFLMGRGWLRLAEGREREAFEDFDALARRPAIVWIADASRRRAREYVRDRTRGFPAASAFLSLAFNQWVVVPAAPEASAVLRADLGRIAALCRGRGVRLLLLGYPFERDVNETFRAFAAEEGLEFLDSRAELGDFVARGLISDDLHHPGAAGYRELAELVRNRLAAPRKSSGRK